MARTDNHAKDVPAEVGPTFTVRERIALTIEHHGLWSLIYRFLTYPLRFTPLKPFLRLEPRSRADKATAARWYKRHGRPVTIVIPSYRDAADVRRLVTSLRATTKPALVTIVVSDDASGPEHLAALRSIPGIEVIEGAVNAGFAANVNRGIRAADPGRDVVVLNSDTIARPHWLAALQWASEFEANVGIVGGKLLYEDNRIQFAGTVRNLGAPEWFDHRYRFRAVDFGPADVPGPALAVTGACMYLTRELIDRVGLLDEEYPMAYEDVDLCLRAWQAGLRVMYCAELRALSPRVGRAWHRCRRA